MSHTSNLTNVVTPKELTNEQCAAVLTRLSRNLARFRNTAYLYATTETSLTGGSRSEVRLKDEFVHELDAWTQDMIKNLWLACREPGGGMSVKLFPNPRAYVNYPFAAGHPPQLDAFSDTSTTGLPLLPENALLVPLLHTAILLQVTVSKEYSSRTRAFLLSIAPIDEVMLAEALKNPQQVIEDSVKRTDAAREEHARKSKIMRMVGIGAGAIAGGVLIGVTGGLAAPAVGAGVSTVLGWLGVGGTAAGVLATGLAGSSVVCGALFGAYGSTKTAMVVRGYTREIRDLAIRPVRPPRDTMATRLCVTGWLASPEDVTEPWTIFEGDDTFALQWVRQLS